MNKVVAEIKAALEPHHVDGFAAMCFPMPTLQHIERLFAEIDRLAIAVNQKDALSLALSLKADSWETAAHNARNDRDKYKAEVGRLNDQIITLNRVRAEDGLVAIDRELAITSERDRCKEQLENLLVVAEQVVSDPQCRAAMVALRNGVKYHKASEEALKS